MIGNRLATLLLAPLTLAAAASPAGPVVLTPTEIVAAAPSGDWADIAASDLLVMDLAPDRGGKPRRVVIQLLPPPFSQGWVGNIRKLAAAHWWDATSVNRVQDNYVVQWGDASEKKALPGGLATVAQRDYEVRPNPAVLQRIFDQQTDAQIATALTTPSQTSEPTRVTGSSDSYSLATWFIKGFPVASRLESYWPLHCYGMVGVGRNLPPDTGTGAELYAVIGHAPRQLDRNIALVGRIVSGIEHLSSLPRGTGALGFYETAAERVPIVSVRLASELPAAERPRVQYLSPDSASFARYADARANRRDPFYLHPAGGVDICNVPVPVRKRP